ncbi:hypothetical protein M9H77_11372 [Catharanthus roseus]|uniref:Uncharacterized protein n=1 Tax=Catharanthus roseus TaxID=4058 RepID=A0ACC0BEG2_CATRO|nr:hypothetical protein M9H77_11372 [Catharanthus roseus]
MGSVKGPQQLDKSSGGIREALFGNREGMAWASCMFYTRPNNDGRRVRSDRLATESVGRDAVADRPLKHSGKPRRPLPFLTFSSSTQPSPSLLNPTAAPHCRLSSLVSSFCDGPRRRRRALPVVEAAAGAWTLKLDAGVLFHIFIKYCQYFGIRDKNTEIARDAYEPYFTRLVQKGWTLPTNRMISHAELSVHILVEFIQIQQQTISSTQVINITNMLGHVTAITHMVSHESSMLYMTVTDDNAEIDHSDEDYVASSQYGSDDNNDAEEEELQTPIIPVTENNAEIGYSDEDYVASSQYESDDNNDTEEAELQTPIIPVTENARTQWESSQWYSNARYDYTQSRAFLDMGSGSLIDDLVESGTIRLLD